MKRCMLAGLLVTLAAGSGCVKKHHDSERLTDEQVADFIRGMRYAKDPHTGKCFAFIWSDGDSSGGLAFTNVACDTAVEALLIPLPRVGP